MYKEIDKSTFDKEIESPAIVDFYTSICPSCVKFAPVFEQKSKEVTEYTFLKVNLDDDISLAERYGISHVPTTIKFIDSKPVKTVTGHMDENQFDEFIKG